jgi:hypothetical protein
LSARRMRRRVGSAIAWSARSSNASVEDIEFL